MRTWYEVPLLWDQGLKKGAAIQGLEPAGLEGKCKPNKEKNT